ncbi:hypothetical protein B0H13DRAFT_2288478 [Mycena leptocephala]|nr:hypothetical protein B0H13DRAFT_2288478 [Mycena leptocephala]
MDTSSTTIPAFSKLGSFKKAVKSLQKQHAVGYSGRSRFHVLRSVLPFFPDGQGIHGEPACDRLRFPLHPSLLKPLHSTPNCSAAKHRDYALQELSHLAGLVKSRDTLVLLLVGHGGVSGGVFEFHVLTGLGRGEASLSKRDLESALKRCKARVLIVCNACYSGPLQSKLWTLVCAAGPGEPSDALAQSGSGVVRGGVFTSCNTRQIGKLGLQLPRPRAVKRSVTSASISIYPEDDIIELQGFFGMLHRGSSPPPSYSSPPPLPTMPAKFGLLALVYTGIIHSPHTTDVLDTRWCVQYLQHLSDPSVHASPFRGAEGADFHLTLRCRNVQCVMVQHLAQTLRWWEGEVTPFVVRPLGGDMWAKKKMAENGMPMHSILEELRRKFDWMFFGQDPVAISWLVVKWCNAGRPFVPAPLWHNAVTSAAAATEEVV